MSSTGRSAEKTEASVDTVKGNMDEEPPSQVFAMTTGLVLLYFNDLTHTTTIVKK